MELQLTEDNFVAYAMRHYDKLHCTVEEFEEDLNRFKTIQRCITKYEATKEINERLILNLILITINTFAEGSVEMLLFKIKKEHWPILRPFLIMLNRDHDKLNETPIDMVIVERLRKI